MTTLSTYFLDKLPPKRTRFGIEIEIENFNQTVPYPNWEVTIDDSLRNNGRELISLPLQLCDVDKALLELKEDLERADPNARCGIHVHMGVESYSVTDFSKLLLLYLLYEPIIFYVSGNREENSFTVPLNINGSFVQELKSIISYSSFGHVEQLLRYYGKKYYALNILPIKSQGTVEFRHHAASNDIKVISKFVNLINNLNSLVKVQYKDWTVLELVDKVVGLNTTSSYDEVARDLLEDSYPEIDATSPEIKRMLRASTFNIRVALNRLKLS